MGRLPKGLNCGQRDMKARDLLVIKTKILKVFVPHCKKCMNGRWMRVECVSQHESLNLISVEFNGGVKKAYPPHSRVTVRTYDYGEAK